MKIKMERNEGQYCDFILKYLFNYKNMNTVYFCKSVICKLYSYISSFGNGYHTARDVRENLYWNIVPIIQWPRIFGRYLGHT